MMINVKKMLPFLFVFLLSFRAFSFQGEQLGSDLKDRTKEESSSEKWGLYFSLNLGPSYQITSLDSTVDDRFVHLGVHPFAYEFGLGYRIWRFRLEASFLHRPMKTFVSRYEVEDDQPGIRFLDYEASLSTHAFNFKVYYDPFEFMTYLNPFVFLGGSITSTHLKTWVERDISHGGTPLEVKGLRTTDLAVLGGIGNTFPVTDSISMSFSSQCTLLQSIETEKEASTVPDEGAEWSQSRPLPRRGLLISFDFLFGVQYEI